MIEHGFSFFVRELRIFAMQLHTLKPKGNVLGTIDQGVNVWAARVAQAANHFGVAMEPVDEKNMWSQVFHLDYSEWMEVESATATPCVRRPSEPEPKRSDRVCIYALAKLCAEPTPLLPAVAKRVLHWLSMHQMRSLADLIDGFEWPKPKPLQELDVCKVLMPHTPTAATDLELDARIVVLRGAMISKPTWSSVITNVSTTIDADVLEPNVASNLQKSALRLRDAAEQRDEARFLLHPDKKANAKPRRRVLDIAVAAPLSRDEAKVGLGRRVEVAIAKNATLHLRWKASYPNASAHFAVCKVCNAVMSDRSAMIARIAWAWECHGRAPSEQRPRVLS